MAKGLGVAFGTDPEETERRAVRRALKQCPDPQVGILASSTYYDQTKLFEAVRRELGNVPLFGTTSPLGISNRGVERDSVILLLLKSDGLDFKVHTGKVGDQPAEIARYLASRYLFDAKPALGDRITCLMAGPETTGQGLEFLRGLREAFPYPLPVSGGASLGEYPTNDLAKAHAGYQYGGNILGRDNLSLLFIRARNRDQIGFGYSCDNSWEPVALPVICTKAEKNIVSEVDGQPIHDYLKLHLGEAYTENLYVLRGRFSFIVRLRDGPFEKTVLRVPFLSDPAKGQVVFWPAEDMQGQEIQLVQLAREDLLAGTKRAAQQAHAALGVFRPEMVLVFTCSVRWGIMNSLAGKELEEVRAVFGDSVPIMGLYCNAEYSPLLNRFEDITNPLNALCGSKPMGCSIAIMALGSTYPTGAEVDYRKLTERFFQEDKAGCVGCEQKRMEYVESQLAIAEQRVSDTEKSLRQLIREQNRNALALKEKNEALLQANTSNEKLQKFIRQYTPHSVWEKASVSVLAGLCRIPDEELFCSFLFMDVKGFTSFAEHHSPDEVIRELNRIFQPATELIYRHRGDVDKFIGDCIFARFESATDALNCSMEVQKRMAGFKTSGSPFTLRIGLNYGRVVSGNVGADMRRENALIGDAVNLAQRMESACPPGGIMVTDEFARQLPVTILEAIKAKKGSVRVKGKEQEIVVWEIPSENCQSV